jgi:tellurite resistance protein TehA-like permease
VRNLSPACFALVMATGIVSIAAMGFDLPLFARMLFVINLLAYAILAGLTLLRAAVYPRLLLADMVDHRTGAGFFTAVAGSCLVGVQFLSIAHVPAVAVSFLMLGAALWAALSYAIFPAYTIKSHKPSLARGISSLWLVAVVGAQSIAVLAALVARQLLEPGRTDLNFFALSMWSWGGMFYVWIITLIFYRYAFFAEALKDIDPPSWINMGAMAISTLAGVHLAQNATDTQFLARLLPFLEGFTVFYWAAGTWWIPMLLILAAWRQFAERAWPRYDWAYWGAVFPLGMYCEATRQMATAFDLRFLDLLSRTMFVAAATAWTLGLAGLLWDLRRIVTRSER